MFVYNSTSRVFFASRRHFARKTILHSPPPPPLLLLLLLLLLLPLLSQSLTAQQHTMASIPRCSYALAAASSAPKSLSYLQRALGLVSGTGGAPSLPILDFLLPSSIASSVLRPAKASRRGFATTTAAPAPATAPAATAPGTRSEVRPRIRQSSALHSSPLSRSQGAQAWMTTASPIRQQQQQQPRSFSSTARRGMTKTLLNPQKDEDGNEMRLEITSRAAKVRLLCFYCFY